MTVHPVGTIVRVTSVPEEAKLLSVAERVRLRDGGTVKGVVVNNDDAETSAGYLIELPVPNSAIPRRAHLPAQILEVAHTVEQVNVVSTALSSVLDDCHRGDRYVNNWPADEQELVRDYSAWSSFEERDQLLHELIYRKVAIAALLAS